MKSFKKIVTVYAVFLAVALLFMMLGYLAIFQIHLAIISTEPDQSGRVLINESYEIRPQAQNRDTSVPRRTVAI